MPWKESSVMDERVRFVARILEGEAMSDVCREFGISRKTGYKIGMQHLAYNVRRLVTLERMANA